MPPRPATFLDAIQSKLHAQADNPEADGGQVAPVNDPEARFLHELRQRGLVEQVEMARGVEAGPVGVVEQVEVEAADIGRVDDQERAGLQLRAQVQERLARVAQVLDELAHEGEVVGVVRQAGHVGLDVALATLDVQFLRQGPRAVTEEEVEGGALRAAVGVSVAVGGDAFHVAAADVDEIGEAPLAPARAEVAGVLAHLPADELALVEERGVRIDRVVGGRIKRSDVLGRGQRVEIDVAALPAAHDVKLAGARVVFPVVGAGDERPAAFAAEEAMAVGAGGGVHIGKTLATDGHRFTQMGRPCNLPVAC